jgi:hypothetical protein
MSTTGNQGSVTRSMSSSSRTPECLPVTLLDELRQRMVTEATSSHYHSEDREPGAHKFRQHCTIHTVLMTQVSQSELFLLNCIHFTRNCRRRDLSGSVILTRAVVTHNFRLTYKIVAKVPLPDCGSAQITSETQTENRDGDNMYL